MQALWMALGALFFALMGVCIRLASGAGYGTFEIVFYRGLTGVVLFAAMLWGTGLRLVSPVPMLHLRRAGAGIVSMCLWFYAIAHLPFASAMTLNSMSSLWLGAIIIAMSYWGTRRIGYPWLFVAVLCGFVGVVLLLNPSVEGNAPLPSFMGLASGVLSAVAYMQLTALGKAGEPELRTVFYFSICTTLVGLLGALATTGLSALHHALAWLLPAVGVCASLGQWCMTRAYTRGPALVVACLQYLSIAYAALLGLWFFQERLSASGWLGMGIVVASGIGATLVRQHRR